MNRPVVVGELDNRLQAESVVNLLAGFGVDGWIVADDLGGIGPGQSFVRGVERAREILGSEEHDEGKEGD